MKLQRIPNKLRTGYASISGSVDVICQLVRLNKSEKWSFMYEKVRCRLQYGNVLFTRV